MDLQAIEHLMMSTKSDDLHQGLALIREEITRVGSDEAKPLFEMVSAIFYIDPLDRPELAPIREEAIALVVGFGKWVIPALIRNLDDGDLKAQMTSADALGRIGADAIEPLVEKYASTEEPATRTFILYALGKIKSPKIARAADLAIEAAQSPDLELRDTATRAIGLFIEAIPAAELPGEVRQAFHDRLRDNLTGPNKGIRAKAVRSLGKMARCGHLDEGERDRLKATLESYLGLDENHNWDRAYVVRKEATEALEYV